jgi:hypothetical protein
LATVNVATATPSTSGYYALSVPTGLADGSDTLKLAYTGDANYAASTMTLVLTVHDDSLALSYSTTAVVGQPYAVSVAINSPTVKTPPTGTLSLVEGTNTLATLNLASATANGSGYYSLVDSAGLAAGTHTLSVVYSGDSNYDALTANMATVTAAGAPTVATPAAASANEIAGNSVQLSVLGADAVNGEAKLTYTWSVTGPSGAAAATFSANGTNAAKNTAVTFHQAGTYSFTADIVNPQNLSVLSNAVSVKVDQTLTGFAISPATVGVYLGSAQAFTAAGTDQFGQAIALPSGTSVSWSVASAVGSTVKGTITSTGALTASYVAPATATKDVVTAVDGSQTATANVTVTSTFLGLQDATLAALVQSDDADGSLNRADMIQILGTAAGENGGVLSAADFSDLKTILSDAATLDMPQYVQVLAGDVVNGNPANAHYQGQTLGNLAVGSTSTQLLDLTDKWFLGTDLPATGGYSYDSTTAGTLFSAAGPSTNDEHQGELGDCYFISALGSIADSSQAAIKNMFIDNGDGTFTVRFYNNGTPDYVTVNRQLPVTSSGALIFDGMGESDTNAANVLWIPLAEKAYAQWNETGHEGRNGTNTYSGIAGGWMSDVDAQALGYPAANYSLTASGSQQALITAVSGGEAVTIGTDSTSNSGDALSYGLYGDHAYAIIGYSSSTGAFTLYNPWGFDQPPAPLTWAQLQQDCDLFTVANPANSTPISATGGAGAVIQPVIAPAPVAPAASVAADSASASASGNVGQPASQQSGGLDRAAVDALLAERHNWSGDAATTAAQYRLGAMSSLADFDSAGVPSQTLGELPASVLDEALEEA